MRQQQQHDASAAVVPASSSARHRGKAGAAAEASQQQRQQQHPAGGGLAHNLLVLLACAGWLVASSGAILVNKHILVDLAFPFPGCVGALGLCGTSLISTLAVRLLSLDGGGAAQPMTLRAYLTGIVPTGLCLALSMQLGNTAYLHLSVAYIQMLKAFTPVVTICVGRLAGMPPPSLPLSVAVCLIAGGVAVASWGEGALSVPGLAAMGASMVCEGARVLATQQLLGQRAMHPLRTLSYLAPAAGGWMLVICGAREVWLLLSQPAAAAALLAAHPHVLAASALAGFAVNSLAMAVIGLTGALSLKCLGLAKDVGLVLYSAVALGEAVSPLQVLGYSVSLAGFVAYNVISITASRRTPAFRASECLLPGGAAGAALVVESPPAAAKAGQQLRSRRPGRKATVRGGQSSRIA